MDWDLDHLHETQDQVQCAQERLRALNEADLLAEAQAVIHEYYDRLYWEEVGASKGSPIPLVWRWTQVALQLGLRSLEPYRQAEHDRMLQDLAEFKATEGQE
jgi:hypothetical protein